MTQTDPAGVMPPTVGQKIFLGRQAGNPALFMWNDEAEAVKFLENDPARKDAGSYNLTRHVWLAQLSNIQGMSLLPPIPARLGVE